MNDTDVYFSSYVQLHHVQMAMAPPHPYKGAWHRVPSETGQFFNCKTNVFSYLQRCASDFPMMTCLFKCKKKKKIKRNVFQCAHTSDWIVCLIQLSGWEAVGFLINSQQHCSHLKREDLDVEIALPGSWLGQFRVKQGKSSSPLWAWLQSAASEVWLSLSVDQSLRWVKDWTSERLLRGIL